mmetsp:Transcript_41555/g.123365  ORF Transcript_41555/g.123365 Transcript_41555/m.123365 type:complete len:194 (-) Transcript_41555:40-621(-)
MTNCQKAIQIWSEKNEGASAEECEVVKLLCLSPPINKMDSTLNSLVACKHLALSTNCIDKMISLPALKNLEILSLGRNSIKKIQGLEEVGATLKELWISYNGISTLDGLNCCTKLTTLFISNNKIKDWGELDKLKDNPDLTNLLMVGNPLYDGKPKRERRELAMKPIAKLAILDGELLAAADDDAEEEEGGGE